MDREKIVKQLNDALLKVSDDINTDLRQPLLHMQDTDWEQVPKLLEDCRYVIDELNKAVAALSETRQSASETFATMQAMYKEWQKTQALTVPSAISEHVRAVIDEFVAGQEELLHIDEVRTSLNPGLDFTRVFSIDCIRGPGCSWKDSISERRIQFVVLGHKMFTCFDS